MAVTDRFVFILLMCSAVHGFAPFRAGIAQPNRLITTSNKVLPQTRPLSQLQAKIHFNEAGLTFDDRTFAEADASSLEQPQVAKKSWRRRVSRNLAVLALAVGTAGVFQPTQTAEAIFFTDEVWLRRPSEADRASLERFRPPPGQGKQMFAAYCLAGLLIYFPWTKSTERKIKKNLKKKRFDEAEYLKVKGKASTDAEILGSLQSELQKVRDAKKKAQREEEIKMREDKNNDLLG